MGSRNSKTESRKVAQKGQGRKIKMPTKQGEKSPKVKTGPLSKVSIRKPSNRKAKTKKTAPRIPVLALSVLEEKELTISTETLEAMTQILEKEGGKESGLTLSDVVTSRLLAKGKNGFKFQSKKSEPKKLKLNLPRAAWSIAESSAEKSETDLAEVVEELFK